MAIQEDVANLSWAQLLGDLRDILDHAPIVKVRPQLRLVDGQPVGEVAPACPLPPTDTANISGPHLLIGFALLVVVPVDFVL